MVVRGPGQQLGQSGLPGAAYRPGKNKLPGEAGWQQSLRGEKTREVMGRLRPLSPEASEVGVGSGKEGAKEAHPEWTPAMWGFPEPHNSLQRRDRNPVFPKRLGPPLLSRSTPLRPVEGPGEPGCQQPPPECPQGHRVLAGPQNDTASGPHGRQGVWHGICWESR